jgi:hypothetical protein
MKRTTKDRERLTDDELAFIVESAKAGQPACPDCGRAPLLEGPSGGLSVNVYCGNDECGSRFNDMGAFGWERITDASPNRPPEDGLKEGPYR